MKVSRHIVSTDGILAFLGKLRAVSDFTNIQLRNSVMLEFRQFQSSDPIYMVPILLYYRSPGYLVLSTHLNGLVDGSSSSKALNLLFL